MASASLDEIGGSLCEIARRAIEDSCLGRSGSPRPPSSLRHGVFVTLRMVDGELRGCMGSLLPTTADLVEETARAAVLAASADPRFSPVAFEELLGIRIEVSVLMPEEPGVSMEQLDPARYGIIVRDQAGRRGLLLPGIPGIDDAATQVRLARGKAGIPADRAVALGRFEVRKFAELVGAAGIEPATSSV